MAVKQVYLAVGDYPNSTDFINLADGNNFICPPEDGLSAPPPSIHRFHSRTRGTQLQTETYRTVTLKLQVFGGAGAGTMDAMLANIAAIEKKGQQARLASGPLKRGTPVALAVMLTGGSNWSYFDVQDVRVTPAAHLWGPVATQEISVELTCLPGIRSTVVQETLGPVLTNGAGATIYRAGVQGQLYAPAQLQLVDGSTGTALRRVRVSIIGGDDQQEGTFVHVNTALINGVGASTVGGTGVLTGSAAQLTPGTSMATVAGVSVAQGNTRFGNLHAYAVVRDSGITMTPPVAVSITPYFPVLAGPPLPAASVFVWMASIDANGNQSSLSTLVTGTVNGQQGLIVAWAPGNGATTLNLYLQLQTATGTATYAIYGLDPAAGSVKFNRFGPVSHVFADTMPATPTVTSVSETTGGSLPPGYYTVVIYNVGQNGELSGGSVPAFIQIVSGSAIIVNITGAATTIAVFLQQGINGSWYYYTTTGAASIEIFSFIALTNQLPPTTRVAAVSVGTMTAIAGGNLPTGSYTARIWAVDADGFYAATFLSLGPISLTAGTQSIRFTLTPVSGQATTIIDLLKPDGAYLRYVFGVLPGITNTYTITSAAVTFSGGTATVSTLQGGVGLTGNDAFINGPIVTAPGGNVWSCAYLGLFPMPPIPRAEGLVIDAYTFRLQAKANPLGTSVVQLAGFIFIPEDEPHFVAEVPASLSPATGTTWILDDPRDQYISGREQSSGTDTISLRTAGELRLAPGNNTLFFLMENLLNAYDTTNLKLQAQIRYIPTYIFLRANDVDQPYKDNFDRGNSPFAIGVADSGQNYTTYNGSYGVANGHFRVSSTTTTYKSFAWVKLTTVPGYFSATVVGTSGGQIFMYFGVVDVDHWFSVGFSLTSAAVLYQSTSTAATPATLWTYDATTIVHVGDVITLHVDINNLELYINGTLKLGLTGLGNVSTAIGIGLGGSVTGGFEAWDSARFTTSFVG